MSSDEIDIEEHDVLADPRLRHLLPELAQVKVEPPEYDEGAQEFGYEPYTQHSRPPVRTQQQPYSAVYNQHQNKIILGSKSTAKGFVPSVSKPVGADKNGGEKNGESVLIFGERVHIKQEIDTDFAEKPNSSTVESGKPSEQIGQEVQAEKGGNVNEDVDMHEKNHDQEQIPENCRVSLVNWGPKLLRSPCYCKECKILFATRNVLDAHKMASHSFLVAVDKNRAMKSTSRPLEDNLKSCAQCNKKFADYSQLLTHVYGHLASKIPVKNKEQDAPKPSMAGKFSNKISLGSKPSSEVSFPDSDSSSDEVQSGFYRCLVCSYYFKTSNMFYSHNLRNHFIAKPKACRAEYDRNCRFCSYRNDNVTLYNKHIAKRHANLYTQKAEVAQRQKIPPQPIASEKPVTQSPKTSPQPVASESLTVIFQCTVCSLVFQNSKKARAHRKNNHPELKSRFVMKKLITKIAPTKTTHNVPDIPPSSTPIKRKAEDPPINPKKPKVDAAKFTVFYCDVCKGTMFGKRHVAMHLEKKCLKFINQTKLICTTCGLRHSSRATHTQFHDKYPEKTIHDFQFVRVQDNALIGAPIPKYPSCKLCGVNVLRALDIQKHECGADYKTCRYCKKTFADDVYTAHVQFHTYIKPETPKREIEAQSTEIPEILKKYQLLTETWNILYLCAVCNIVTDSYDKAVEHSQKHFNNLENYDVTIKQCQFCRLMFEETCLERHMDIHKENKLINKESFRILSYDYSKLLTKDWFELFENLPKAQIQQIVSRSIYNYCRSVKMTVFLDGAPEMTLYQCRICRSYVHPPSVARHKLLVCLRNAPKNYCNVCNIPFSSVTGRDAHLATHNNRGNYRHVIFNAPEDADFDVALNTNNEEVPKEITSKLKKKKVKHTVATKYSGNYSVKNMAYIFFVCSKCNVHISRRENAASHKCTSRQNVLIRCKICGLNIYTSGFNKHKMKHETNKRYVRKNMRIIKFTPREGGDAVFENNSEKNTEAKLDEYIANLIKCRCGLHFTAKKTYDKHSLSCSPNLKIARKDCKACGYTFDAIEMMRHKSVHHSDDRNAEFLVIAAEEKEDNYDTSFVDVEQLDDAENDNTNDQCDDDEVSGKHKLYRCGSCNLLFHVKVDIVRHLSVCDPKANKENKCVKCGLAFYSTVLTHMLKVNNCNQLTEDDYDIVTLFPRETAEVDEDKKLSTYAGKQNWLYKCWKCDVHWMSSSVVTFYHYKNNHVMNAKVYKCEICGLQFPCSSIKKHQRLHHQQLNLTREDFHIHIVSGGDNPNLKVDTKPKRFPKWSVMAKKVVAGAGVQASTLCNRLYRCQGCELTFLSSKTRCRHVLSARCGKVKGVPCKRCSLVLNSDMALKVHNSIHHDRLNLKMKDFIIQVYKSRNINQQKSLQMMRNKKSFATQNSLYRKLYFCPKCPLKFLVLNSLRSHMKAGIHGNGVKCSVCHYMFSKVSLFKHRVMHHQKMKLTRKHFVLASVDIKDLDDTEISTKVTKKQTEETSDNDEFMNDRDNQITAPLTENAVTNKHVSSTIIKCKQCSLHFVSLQAYLSHIKRGVHNGMKGRKCSICGFKFSHISLKKHKFLHHIKLKLHRKDMRVSIGGLIPNADDTDMSTKLPKELSKHSTTIKASTPKDTPSKTSVTSSLGDLTEETLKEPRPSHSYTLSEAFKRKLLTKHHDNKLYKCDRCGLHFITLKTVQWHAQCVKGNSGNIDKCSICGLWFSIKTLSRHFYIHHEQLNLELEDLDITVYNTNQAAKCSPAEDVDTENKQRAVTSAKETGKEINPFHLSEVIKAELDEKNYGSDLYKCLRCNRHFLNSVTKATHVSNCLQSNQNNADCPICGLTFSISTLSRHFYVHHEKLNLYLKDFNIITGEEPRSAKKFYTLSEAAKADIDLTIYSNKLYKCSRCKRHFINLTSRKCHERKCTNTNSGDIQDCSICGLAFSVTSLAKHIYIHHEKLDLELEDFDIIKNLTSQSPRISTNSYEFDGSYYRTMPKVCDNISDMSLDVSTSKNLRKRGRDDVSESSFDLSRTSHNLTADDDDGTATPISARILDEYKKFPLSLKVLKSLNISQYDNKLYHCTICGAYFILRNTLERHVDDNRHVYQLIDCHKCHYKFSPQLLPRHDYVQHRKLQYTREDLQVITDVEVQRTLNKCVKCNAHYLSQNHKCVSSLHQCIICDLMFTAKSLNPHYEKHHRKLKLSPEDFIIIETGIETDVDKNDAIDDKDASERDYTEPSTSKQSLDTSTNKPEIQAPMDVEEIEPATNIPPAKVTQASKETPQKELSLHNLSDEPPDLEMSTLNPNLYDNKLFRCNLCSLHFLAKENFEWHKHNSDHTSVRKIHCTICNLAFSAQTLATHTFVHHEKLKLGVKDFIIIESSIPEKEVDVDDSVVSQSSDESYEEKKEEPPEKSSSNEVFSAKKYTSYTTKLYKCSECNVHFISQATCYKHTHKNHVPLDAFDYIACKICGLEFGNMILPKHVIQHHKNKEFNLDQVLVEAYTPRKEAGAPKMELYLAIDKVQSKLVSTTTEKYVPVTSTSTEKITSEIAESTTSTDNKETTTEKSDTVVETSQTNMEKLQCLQQCETAAKTAEETDISISTVEQTSTQNVQSKEIAVKDVETTAEVVETSQTNMEKLKCVQQGEAAANTSEKSDISISTVELTSTQNVQSKEIAVKDVETTTEVVEKSQTNIEKLQCVQQGETAAKTAEKSDINISTVELTSTQNVQSKEIAVKDVEITVENVDKSVQKEPADEAETMQEKSVIDSPEIGEDAGVPGSTDLIERTITPVEKIQIIDFETEGGTNIAGIFEAPSMIQTCEKTNET